MTPRAGLAAAGLLAGIAAVAIGIRWFSDEAVIARELRAAARAAEEERLLGVASRVSRRYTDSHGLGYESLLGAAADAFGRYDDIDASLSVGAVSVSGATATADVTLSVTGVAGGVWEAIVGGGGEPLRLRLELREERQGWVVERATRTGGPEPGAP